MIVAIPDIHGRWDLFSPLIAKLSEVWGFDFENPSHQMIVLGDMIDRGSQSREVIDWVWRQTQIYPKQCIALKGNHEALCIAAYRSLHAKYGDPSMPMVFQTYMYGSQRYATDDCELWVINGGLRTAQSWPNRYVPSNVVEWLADLPLSYETEEFFFSHAPAPKQIFRHGKDVGEPYDEQELTWTYFEGLPEDKWCERPKGKIGVCGHIHALHRGFYEPRFYYHYYFLDAGCGCSDKAPLVAVNVETKEVLYAWPDRMKKRFG